MVSSTLATLLASRRSLFNREVAEARHRWPGFDTAAFNGFITQTLDPVCVAVAAIDGSATPLVAETGFSIGLELVAQGLAGPGARMPWVDAAWQQLAVPAAALVAQAPLETLGALSNAVVRLDGVAGTRVPEWIAMMQPLVACCDTPEALRTVGALCAWQAGMAPLRQAALLQAAGLPKALLAAALGVDEAQGAAAHERALGERWWNPRAGGIDPQGWTLGGFTGLGGPFPTPPEVRASDTGFIVRSGERHFLLMADGCGGVVLPASATEFQVAHAAVAEQVSFDAQGARIAGKHIHFDTPTEGLTAIAGPAGVAISSPWSHHVRVVPGAA
ncbi:hypothetical protein [Stenotrophomonas sp. SY1]|uniref:hypothetical protein n=1 Tax=Stenotrophomonas sp. SY1 TaxID=477235 RepID=UPI001E5ECD90|nr:hypothetical protein [Stenotrophomonas sp. SY1]